MTNAWVAVFTGSSLLKVTRDLVALRVSQINGCGWCVRRSRTSRPV